MIGICLVAASVTAFIPADSFTLAWTHSIEKVRWEEDYQVIDSNGQSAQLVLMAVAARIKGSGAGMEPPADAKLRDGWFEYRPTAPPLTELRLARSEYTEDYDLCIKGRCEKMSVLAPGLQGLTVMTGCRR